MEANYLKYLVDTEIKFQMVERDGPGENRFELLKEPFTIKVAVFVDDEEAKFLRGSLGELAKLGVPVSITSPYFADLHGASIARTRNYIKDFTRHNDKLGFDYSKVKRQLVASYGDQFQESAYREFVQEAARRNLGPAKEHFEKMSQKFEKPRKQFTNLRSGSDFNNQVQSAKEAGYERTLARQIFKQDYADFENKLSDYEKERDDLLNQIQRYAKNQQLTSQAIMQFPAVVKEYTKRYAHVMTDYPDIVYARSILDAFHPTVSGVRVPQLMPVKTSTQNTYYSASFSTLSTYNGPTLLISNHTCAAADPLIYIEPTPTISTSAIFNSNPIRAPVSIQQNALDSESSTIICDLVPLGLQSEAVQIVKRIQSNMNLDLFTKQRLVSSTNRIFKTSANENESGTLYGMYHPKGLHFESSKAISQEIGRPGQGKAKLYLASIDRNSCCHGKSGFLVQSSYRPTLTEEVEQFSQGEQILTDPIELFVNHPEDVSSLVNRDEHVAAAGVYFARSTAANSDNHFMIDFGDIANAAADDTIYLVLNSLTQKHSSLFVIDNTTNMSFEFEMMQHFEGILNNENLGLNTAQIALPNDYTNAIQLQRKIDPHVIFASPTRVREKFMIDLIEQRRRAGIWDETFLPMFQDVLSWGIDQISTTNLIEELVDGAGDLAALALMAVSPELEPIYLAIKPTLSDMATKALENQVQNLRQWSDQGPHKLGSGEYGRQIISSISNR